MTRSANTRKQQILDSALLLADKTGWDAVRLNQVAKNMGITLNQIREIFDEKEDVIDAWFDRADSSMLRTAESAEFEQLDTANKLHRLLMNWLASLATHKKVTRQMILGKLEFGHIHYQFSGLLRISRTVQWWRDAAGIRSTLPRRAFDETALTVIYLATFTKWLFDNSKNSKVTRDFLKNQLDKAARIDRIFSTKVRSSSKTAHSAQASL